MDKRSFGWTEFTVPVAFDEISIARVIRPRGWLSRLVWRFVRYNVTDQRLTFRAWLYGATAVTNVRLTWAEVPEEKEVTP